MPATTDRVALVPSGPAAPSWGKPVLAVWRVTALAGLGAAALVVGLRVAGIDPEPLIGPLQLLSAGAAVAGIRTLRPSLTLPWWLLGAGLAVRGASRTALAVPAVAESLEANLLVRAVQPVGLGLYVAAALVVVVARARGRPLEQLLSAGVLCVGAGLVAAEGARVLLTAPVGLSRFTLSPLVVVVAGVLLVAVTVHLWRGDRQLNGAVVLLIAAATARLVRDLLGIGLTGAGDAAVASSLTPLSSGLVAAAMLHPRSARLPEPVERFQTASPGRQALALGGALGVLPLLALSLALQPPWDQRWLWAIAVGMVALTSLVLARVLGLVRSLAAATELRNAEARRDLATGLPNARALLEDLDERMRAESVAGRPALMVLSLRGVGEAESVHGLGASAELLRALADRLASAVPAGSTVAVLSGQDLAVALPVEPAMGLEALAWQLHELITCPVEVSEAVVSCGAGIGIATHDAGESPEALLRRADLASRWAERPNASHVQRYERPMGSHVAYEVSVRAGIREAIRREELRLWCQPQVEVTTGRLAGVECLARWYDTRRGDVPPAVFVAAAREAGVAAALDARMVRAAARQAARWRRAGLFVPHVAVNVEPTSLSEPGFVDLVADALWQAALPPGTLEIELTEAVTAPDQAEAREVLWRLRALGVRLAIDDFGTGYSSLATLHRLPMDVLKLDRELVTLLADAPSVVTATAALAERLGLQLVAEGVETREQLVHLEQLGCGVVQGFFLAEPMPTDQLPVWYRRHAARPLHRLRGHAHGSPAGAAS